MVSAVSVIDILASMAVGLKEDTKILSPKQPYSGQEVVLRDINIISGCSLLGYFQVNRSSEFG